MESTLFPPPWWKVSLSLSKSNDLDLNHSSRCRTEIYQSTIQSIFSSLLEVEILQSSSSKLPGGEYFIHKFCNQKILASNWHLLFMQNQRGWSWTNSWKCCWQVKCLHSELFWSVFPVFGLNIVLDTRKTFEVWSSFLLEYLVHVDQFLSVFQYTRLEKVFECFFHLLMRRWF